MIKLHDDDSDDELERPLCFHPNALIIVMWPQANIHLASTEGGYGQVSTGNDDDDTNTPP